MSQSIRLSAFGSRLLTIDIAAARGILLLAKNAMSVAPASRFVVGREGSGLINLPFGELRIQQRAASCR